MNLIVYVLAIGTLQGAALPKDHQPPAPQAQNKGTPAESRAQLPEPAAPLPRLDPQDTQRRTAHAENQGNSKSPTDSWLVRFTGGLFLVGIAQLFLFWWQLYLIRASLKDAAIAATAARDSVEISRKQFIGAMRPRLHVRQVARMERDSGNNIEYVIANIGASNARIIENLVVFHMLAKGTPMPVRPLAGAPNIPGEVLLAPGEAAACEWVDDLDGVQLPMADAMRAHMGALIMGRITYEDDAGIKRQTGFIRKYDPDSHRFGPVDDPDYEYAD